MRRTFIIIIYQIVKIRKPVTGVYSVVQLTGVQNKMTRYNSCHCSVSNLDTSKSLWSTMSYLMTLSNKIELVRIRSSTWHLFLSAYHEKLKEAGVPSEAHLVKGGIHAYFSMPSKWDAYVTTSRETTATSACHVRRYVSMPYDAIRQHATWDTYLSIVSDTATSSCQVCDTPTLPCQLSETLRQHAE